MTDVIIFQMGKVASAAIQEALRAAGVEAAHSHFLGEKSLVNIMRALVDPRRLHPDFIRHGTGQLVQNIDSTRQLNWYRAHKTKDGKKLKIITLARDPINWYRANFLQNFDQYFHRIQFWGRANVPQLEDSPAAYLGPFFQFVFDTVADLQLPLDAPNLVEAVRALKLECQHPGVVHEHLFAQSRPVRWFDEQLKCALDVDVYSESFDPEIGYRIYENGFCEVLLIKFETLSAAWDTIRNFVGLDELPAERRNVSAEKPHAAEIAAAFEDLVLSPETLDRIFSTRYCQFFRYEPSVTDSLVTTKVANL